MVDKADGGTYLCLGCGTRTDDMIYIYYSEKEIKNEQDKISKKMQCALQESA